MFNKLVTNLLHNIMKIVMKDDSFHVIFHLMDHRIYSNPVAISAFQKCTFLYIVPIIKRIKFSELKFFTEGRYVNHVPRIVLISD